MALYHIFSCDGILEPRALASRRTCSAAVPFQRNCKCVVAAYMVGLAAILTAPPMSPGSNTLIMDTFSTSKSNGYFGEPGNAKFVSEEHGALQYQETLYSYTLSHVAP